MAEVVACVSLASLNAQPLVIRNVTVVPMTADTLLPNRTVTFANGVIASIVPTALETVAANSEIVDGTGKFLMPGMVEMHAHLPYGHVSQPTRPTYFKHCLAAGVTGLRSMRGLPEHLALRDSILRKQVLAPDLYLSALLPTRDSGWDGSALRTFVSQAKRDGWDFLKYLGGISPALCDSAVAICREYGMRIAGHSLNRNLRRSVDANFASIEHYADFVQLFKTDSAAYEQLVKDMVARSVYFCPTLAWYHVNGFRFTDEQLFARSGMPYVDTALVTVWKQDYLETRQDAMKDTAAFRTRMENIAVNLRIFNRLLKRFVDAGGRLLCGAEPSEFLVPGFCEVEELRLFCAAGLTPYQALKSATVEPAAYFNASATIGTVEVGKNANLVLLDANPLTSIENISSIVGTILHGEWYAQHDLLK